MRLAGPPYYISTAGVSPYYPGNEHNSGSAENHSPVQPPFDCRVNDDLQNQREPAKCTLGRAECPNQACGSDEERCFILKLIDRYCVDDYNQIDQEPTYFEVP